MHILGTKSCHCGCRCCFFLYITYVVRKLRYTPTFVPTQIGMGWEGVVQCHGMIYASAIFCHLPGLPVVGSYSPYLDLGGRQGSCRLNDEMIEPSNLGTHELTPM